MRYLQLPSRTAAEAISHRVALSNGSGKPGQVTQFWFSLTEAPDGEAVLSVPEKDVRHLDKAEVEKLIDKRPTKFEPEIE